MKKYRCPHCKEVFIGTKEVCPKCGVKLRYADKTANEKVEEEAVIVSNFSFNDPEVIKHEEKFVPVTSIESMDDKQDEDPNNPQNAQLGFGGVPQHRIIVTGESFFNGPAVPRFAVHFLAFLLFFLSLTIATPWLIAMVARWDTNNTVIQGHRLKFTGKGIQLFGKYLLWLILTPLTIGIILIWAQIVVKRWIVKNTVFAD